MNSKTISQIKNTKKYLLSLFDDEDVFIEKNEFDGVVVRPKKNITKTILEIFCCKSRQ